MTTRSYCKGLLDFGVRCLLVCNITACAIPIRDHEWCADMGKDKAGVERGAFCVHTFSKETRRLDAATWSALRGGQFCTVDPDGKKGDTLTDIKGTIEKLCSVTSCELPKP